MCAMPVAGIWAATGKISGARLLGRNPVAGIGGVGIAAVAIVRGIVRTIRVGADEVVARHYATGQIAMIQNTRVNNRDDGRWRADNHIPSARRIDAANGIGQIPLRNKRNTWEYSEINTGAESRVIRGTRREHFIIRLGIFDIRIRLNLLGQILRFGIAD